MEVILSIKGMFLHAFLLFFLYKYNVFNDIMYNILNKKIFHNIKNAQKIAVKISIKNLVFHSCENNCINYKLPF